MQNFIVYIALILIMLTSGCGIVLTEHEESTIPFGSSVNYAVRQQTLNPEAANDAPVTGLDGRYAAAIAKKYQEGPRTDSSSGQSVSEVIIEAK